MVLGAGVVGVATAWSLLRAGHEVSVVERQPGPALETSFANGGQISANHATPWATPQTPMKVLKWMGREESPLLFRLRLDPALWSWGLRFLKNCTADATRANTEAALRIALYSRDRLKALCRETDIDYQRLERGILHIYRNQAEYDAAVPQAGLMTELGCNREVMTVAQCLELEPALSQCADTLVGGIFSPDDESGDAYAFTKALADKCAEAGAEFHYETPIDALAAGGDKVLGVDTPTGRMTADAYVVCLGSYGPRLLRPIGIDIPVYPVKGYSVTIPVTERASAPVVSLIDDEYKMVYSRLGDRLRVAGTAELTGWDSAMNERRARAILNRAMTLFPECGNPGAAEFWAGLRPMAPDSRPVIGPTPVSNLYLNTGHGALGWTMACGSGQAIADLIDGSEPGIDLSGLGLERFG